MDGRCRAAFLVVVEVKALEGDIVILYTMIVGENAAFDSNQKARTRWNECCCLRSDVNAFLGYSGLCRRIITYIMAKERFQIYYLIGSFVSLVVFSLSAQKPWLVTLSSALFQF